MEYNSRTNYIYPSICPSMTYKQQLFLQEVCIIRCILQDNPYHFQSKWNRDPH